MRPALHPRHALRGMRNGAVTGYSRARQAPVPLSAAGSVMARSPVVGPLWRQMTVGMKRASIPMRRAVSRKMVSSPTDQCREPGPKSDENLRRPARLSRLTAISKVVWKNPLGNLWRLHSWAGYGFASSPSYMNEAISIPGLSSNARTTAMSLEGVYMRSSSAISIMSADDFAMALLRLLLTPGVSRRYISMSSLQSKYPGTGASPCACHETM